MGEARGPRRMVWDGQAWVEEADLILYGRSSLRIGPAVRDGVDGWQPDPRDRFIVAPESRPDGLGGRLELDPAAEEDAKLDDEWLVAGHPLEDDETPDAARRRRRLLGRLREWKLWPSD